MHRKVALKQPDINLVVNNLISNLELTVIFDHVSKQSSDAYHQAAWPVSLISINATVAQNNLN